MTVSLIFPLIVRSVEPFCENYTNTRRAMTLESADTAVQLACVSPISDHTTVLSSMNFHDAEVVRRN